MEQIQQHVMELAIPVAIAVITYVGKFLDARITRFFANRKLRQAEKWYGLAADAVRAVFDNGVREKKASGEKLSPADQSGAMSSALSRMRSAANAGGIALPDEGVMRDLVEQVIANRKGGLFANPFAAGAASFPDSNA